MFGEGKERMPRISISRLLLLPVAFVVVMGFFSSAATIDAGTVGVVKRLGRVTGQVLDPGFHLIFPFIDQVIIYNTKDIIYETTPVEKQAASKADYIDYPVDTTTEDGQQVNICYSIRFRVKRSEAPQIAQNLGDETAVVEKVVKFHSRVLCRQIPRKYAASELYTGDVTVVQNEIVQQMRPLFEAKGLELDSLGIREITFSSDYVAAIEQKQIEKEKVTTEQYRAEQAKFRKQATITEAEGEAEAIRIKGVALKENPDMVQLEFVKSLRDPESKVKVMVIPGEGVLPLLNLGTTVEGE
ncbi:MAG: prohibitin family protein [Chloroflexota bacterium]|nr:prohibitin family protein [Chloroflexota bacterium]